MDFFTFGADKPRGAIDRDMARSLGILDPEALEKYGAANRRAFLIEGLVGEHTINLAVGNSGLGKTPLVVSMSVSIASGKAWLGRSVRQGRALICDGESSYPEFYEIVANLCKYMNIEKLQDFFVWSPMWAPYREDEVEFGATHLEKLVATIQPHLVVIDPIRMFFPRAEGKSEDTMAMFKVLRRLTKKYGTSWVLVHHRRKIDSKYQIDLEEDPLQWFQQSCGSLALVNHTDTRMGLDLPKTDKNVDLVLSGFVRSHGRFGPLHLGRVYDDAIPIAYRQLIGLDFLPAPYQTAYQALDPQFRTAAVKKALGGNSDSNAAAFLRETQGLGLIRKLGHGLYEKIVEKPETIEIPQETDQ